MIGGSEDPRQIACVLPPETFHSVWWDNEKNHMSIACLAPKGPPSRDHRGHRQGQLSAGVVESWDTVAARVSWTPPQVCRDRSEECDPSQQPGGEPDHIWYLVCLSGMILGEFTKVGT